MNNLPKMMKAVVTTGNGGYDKLEYRDVPRPEPGPGEVLLKVLAAGMNNTEINTRVGWYASNVTTGTEGAAVIGDGISSNDPDGGWNTATPFPLIQGTDCCGVAVAAGSTEDETFIGKRALIRACLRPKGYASPENIWLGVDMNGAFAQFVKVPASAVVLIDCDWSDAELATIPCAYGTAENMAQRANIETGDTVLITGASGGVGSAMVQLAKCRGATVIAIAGTAKMDQVKSIGADKVFDRSEDILANLGEKSVDVVVDVVGGEGFGNLIKVLVRGGRYVSAGAIGGPNVNFDMRDFYLKDLTLIGCTGWDEGIFENLVSRIERGEIKPILAKTFPLDQIAAAQAEFLQKQHTGNLVLIPPAVT